MRLLDAKEVAEILQVNVQRTYELTRQGVLPSVRIGPKQIRFEETRLMQWIETWWEAECGRPGGEASGGGGPRRKRCGFFTWSKQERSPARREQSRICAALR